MQCTKTVNSSGDWSNPDTFSPSGLPGTDDVVCINGSSVLSFNVASATVVGIVAAADSTLNMSSGGGTLTLSGAATGDQASTIGHLVGAGATLNATTKEPFPTKITFLDSCLITGPGDYRVVGGATGGGAGGICFLSGTVSPAPTITLGVNMTLTGPWVLTRFRLVIETGMTLTLQNWGITLADNAGIENHGTLNLAPVAGNPDPDITALAPVNSVIENAAGATIIKSTAGSTGLQRIAAPVINDGTITNASPGTLVLGGANILSGAPGKVIISGPVSGSGTFTGDLFHDDGALAPGHPTAFMSVSGDYTIRTGLSPTLAIEIAGPFVGQFDALDVNGACNLAGTLSVTLLPGYTPALNDTFPIVSCKNGRFGTFATTILPQLTPPLAFEVVYGFNNVTLRVTTATAATFRSFTASRARGGVLLRWRTGTEVGLVGFNVYRQRGAKRLRLNRALIRARGGVGGASYSWLHRRTLKGGRYWLQVVDVDGSRQWYGGIRFTGD